MRGFVGSRRTARLVAIVIAAMMIVPTLGGCALLGADQAEILPMEGVSQDYSAPPPGSDERLSTDMGAAEGEALYAEDKAVASEPAPSGGAGADASAVPPEERLVILNQSLRLEVDEVDATITSMRDLVGKHAGQITDMQVSTDDDSPIYRYDESGYGGETALRAYITVRVPGDKVEAFIAEASALGKVLRQSQSAQDVTQEHVDLTARLGNLQAEEKRLREFFASAKKVSEMLEIERELARVRGEIESIDAQKKYLERQAAMATVTFELVEPKPVVRPSGESWGFMEAITQSIRAFVGTINVLVVVLGPLLALLIFVGLPAFLVIRWLVRRLRKRHVAAQKAAEDQEAPPVE